MEDDDQLRSVLARVLRRLGYGDVVESSTPEDAVGAMAQGPADLVILDVSLGEQSGCVLAREILGRWPSTRLLFLSGHEPKELTLHGCPKWLPLVSKPFKLSGLHAAITERFQSPVWYPAEWRDTAPGSD